jgi:hypothetical protein
MMTKKRKKKKKEAANSRDHHKLSDPMYPTFNPTCDGQKLDKWHSCGLLWIYISPLPLKENTFFPIEQNSGGLSYFCF